MASEEGKRTGRQPDDRFASFDYCFNYFQSFRDKNRVADICSAVNIEQSCLQIGFYLASWGMLRGSSFLLDKSAKFYEPLLTTIIELDKEVWSVDVDTYTAENVDILLEAANAIRNALDTRRWPSDTLVTKIMLGVFGNTPAFDSYFGDGLGLRNFNRKNLQRVAEFYHCHESVIDECSKSLHTLAFVSGVDTNRHYSKAKIVDMVGFMEGFTLALQKKSAMPPSKDYEGYATRVL
jgi:hypothetical protein